MSEGAGCKSVGSRHKILHRVCDTGSSEQKQHKLKIRLSALRDAQSEAVCRPAELLIRAEATFSQNRRDMLFFHISPHWRCFEKSHDSVPAQRSRGLLSPRLISFLVSCPNREPQEETVFTERSAAAAALWSLKAAETHVWYFCSHPRWTWQVHVTGASQSQTNAHISIWFSPRRGAQQHRHIQIDRFPTDLEKGKSKRKAELLFQGRLRIVSRAEGKARYCSLSCTQTPRSLKNFSKLYKIFLLVHTTTADDGFSFGFNNCC